MNFRKMLILILIAIVIIIIYLFWSNDEKPKQSNTGTLVKNTYQRAL